MKKIILRLLSCAIVLALLAALTIFVINPLFKEEEHNLAEVNIMYYEGPTKAMKMENDKLAFELLVIFLYNPGFPGSSDYPTIWETWVRSLG